MSARLLVGVDVGTSAVKAIAVDADRGAVVAVSSSPLDLDTPRPGWAEQDPRAYVEAAQAAILGLGRRVRLRDVVAVGLTGQMHTAVLLDAARQPVRPAMLWCDGRATDACASIRARVGDERLARTVMNRALEGFTLPKLVWLAQHEPESFARVEHVLMPKDYVALWLTGEIATDVSDASGTLAFEPIARRWSDEVLDAVGVPREIWPRFGESTDLVGQILPDVAAATGLPQGTPVVHGAADNAAAAVGLGVVTAGRALASIGTSGVVLAHADPGALVPDAAMRLHAFCHAVPGRFYRMGVMLSAGGALRWYRDVLCDGERIAAELASVDPYQVITEAASTSRAGANGVVFLPYLLGERTPHHDPDARGALVGVTARTTKADISRAVLEGITYGLADSLALLRESGAPIASLRVTGGGAKSGFWRQLLADVFDAEILTTTSAEGPAFGAAMLAAVGAGVFGSVEEAAEALVHVTSRATPDPIAASRYAQMASVYRGLYGDLAARFQALAAFA